MPRILVVQTAFLGDIVLTTPLLREIKRVQSDGSITVLTTPLGRAVLDGHPSVDAIVAYDKKGRERGPLGLVRIARALRRERFDVAVAAQRSSRTGLLLRESGAPVRVGFAGASGAWAYSHRIAWDGTRHAVHRYLALAGPLGGDPAQADPQPLLAVSDVARRNVESLLREVGIAPKARILAVSPGSIWGTKRWTPDGFAAVIKASSSLGVAPVLTGTIEEAPLCREVADIAALRVPVLAGRTGLPEFIALLARADAIVTNDSGPGHVASAVGTPVVAIFGPTVPAFGYGPFGPSHRIVEHPGLDCRPCDPHGPQICPLEHHRCMKDIPAARVIEAVAGALAARGG